MKKELFSRLIYWLFIGFLVASCSSKTVLPVANLSAVKPLSDKQQLEKQLYFSEAVKYYEFHDWQSANSLFRKAINIDPGCDACFYELATMHFRAGYLKEALSLSRSAITLDPTNFWYHVQLAQIYATVRQNREAIAEYRYLLKERPGMEDLYYDLSALYVRINELDSALLVLNTAQQKIGNTEQIYGAQFDILKAQRKDSAALKALTQLVDEFPEPRYYSLLGEQYANQQFDTLALQMFRSALDLDSDYTPALLGEADIYRRRGDFDTFFQRLYVLYANKKVEQEYKQDYLASMLQIPQFTQTFTRQIDSVFMVFRTPPDSLTEPIYTTFLMQMGKRDSAVTVLKNNLQNNIQSKVAWHHYLTIEYYVNNWDTLSRYAEQAHVRFPNEVDFMSMKAIALWQTQQESDAIYWLEKTLPLTKNDPKQTTQTYAFLGDLYHSEKKAKKAYEYYEKALALDSSNVVVLNNYAYYLSEENKQLGKAYAMSKKAITLEPDNATYLDTFGWILFKMGKAIEAKAIFRHAMIYGGKDSAVILDHYGDVLHALGENDMAVIYWDLSLQKEPNPKISEKVNKLK